MKGILSNTLYIDMASSNLVEQEKGLPLVVFSKAKELEALFKESQFKKFLRNVNSFLYDQPEETETHCRSIILHEDTDPSKVYTGGGMPICSTLEYIDLLTFPYGELSIYSPHLDYWSLIVLIDPELGFNFIIPNKLVAKYPSLFHMLQKLHIYPN